MRTSLVTSLIGDYREAPIRLGNCPYCPTVPSRILITLCGHGILTTYQLLIQSLEMNPLNLSGNKRKLPLSYHCWGGAREKGVPMEPRRSLGQRIRKDWNPLQAVKGGKASRRYRLLAKRKDCRHGLGQSQSHGQKIYLNPYVKGSHGN